MPNATDRLGIEKGKSGVTVYIGLTIKAQLIPPDAPAPPHGAYPGG